MSFIDKAKPITKTNVAPSSTGLSFASKIKPVKQQISTPTTPYTPPASGIKGFSIGLGKGILSTVKGAGQLGEKILTPVANVVGIPKPNTYSEISLQNDAEKGGAMGKIFNESNLTPENTAEKIGFGTEKVAELVAPAGSVTRSQKLIDTALHGSGLIKGIGRVLGKAAIEGGTTGGVTLLQSGGDIKKAGKAAMFAGTTKAALSTAGEVLNAAKVPEKLYQTIFKNSSRDMLTELKSEGTIILQKNDPERFKQLVDSGIIQVGKDGNARVNETLAEKALDRGLKGSLKNMSNETVRQLYESEAAAREIAAKHTGTIKIPETEKLASLLDEVSADYKNVGGNFSDEAKSLADAVKNDSIDATTGLKLRRFLDGMRIRSSFNPGQKLSQSQENFKYFADATRGQLGKINGFKDIMKNYSFQIDALDAIAKEAARKGNRQLLGFIDSALLGGGMAAGTPITGAGIGIARRILQSSSGLTKGAQVIKNLDKSTKAGVGLRSVLGNTLSNY